MNTFNKKTDGTFEETSTTVVKFTTDAVVNVWSTTPVTRPQAAVYTGGCIILGMFMGKWFQRYMENSGKVFLTFGE